NGLLRRCPFRALVVERSFHHDCDTAGGNLLRGGGSRRTGRGPLQLRPVRVGAKRETRGKGADLIQIAGYIPAALLGRAVGDPVRALVRCCLDAPVRVRLSLLPRAGAGAVPDFSADERGGIFRAAAGRADVHDLPAAGEAAVRDYHCLGRNGDQRAEAVGKRSAGRLGVSVATSGDVRDQPKVADGASELLQDVFGKGKNPSRLVYGVASLPLGVPVALEIIFEVVG